MKGEATAKLAAAEPVADMLALRTIEKEHMRGGVDSLNSEEILMPSPHRIRCTLH
jgi:hypothetical protein